MTTVNTATSALDFAQIAQLKSNAQTDQEGSLKEVAQQFESIFINMMLQSMRKATERSGLMDSDAAQTYESMFDQELALHLSDQGGFGVAEALERQMQMNQSRNRPMNAQGLPLQPEANAASKQLRFEAGTYAIARELSANAWTIER